MMTGPGQPIAGGHLLPAGPINVKGRHSAPHFCTQRPAQEEGLPEVVIPPALPLKKDPQLLGRPERPALLS